MLDLCVYVYHNKRLCIPCNLLNFYLESSEFAAPGTFPEQHCAGRLCAKCGKCRDWYYTGNITGWHWIQNHSFWGIGDLKRYCIDHRKLFKKRTDGATCRRDHHRLILGLFCLCENNFHQSLFK